MLYDDTLCGMALHFGALKPLTICYDFWLSHGGKWHRQMVCHQKIVYVASLAKMPLKTSPAAAIFVFRMATHVMK